MNRLRNWDVRLFHWADSIVGEPFEWGVTDCGTIVSRAHVVMYGEDVFGWPTYKSLKGAMSAKAKVGGIRKALKKDCMRVGVKFARTGDIVLIKHKGEEGMGLVVGSNVVGTYPGYPVTLLPLSVLPRSASVWRVL